MQKKTPIRDFIKGVNTSFTDNSNVEIIGSGRVVLEEIRRIIEYSDNAVRVVAGKKTVCVDGINLTLNNYSDKTLVIDGVINSVNFNR